ncbi:hypothetical protein, partial [Ferrimicrobium sp.]|uniref:hypothetical protein n=1 Tax=Ferrimicrobium sp. TaxID=2926050 RepID=UPI0026060616
MIWSRPPVLKGSLEVSSPWLLDWVRSILRPGLLAGFGAFPSLGSEGDLLSALSSPVVALFES